jgi:hypothetical protein
VVEKENSFNVYGRTRSLFIVQDWQAKKEIIEIIDIFVDIKLWFFSLPMLPGNFEIKVIPTAIRG